MARVFLYLSILTLVASCGARPDLTLQPQAKGVGDEISVFFSTTRVPDAEGIYQPDRAAPSYGQVVVSVPPNHQQGKVEMRAAPDPQRDFTAIELAQYDDPTAFRRALAAELRKRPADEREVILFVHGFNNTFGESLFRMAQLAHDFEFPGVAVHYSWSSAANLFGYTHDRDSALFARDGLEELLLELNRVGATEVQLVAHSMGSELSMEAMRQISIRSPGEATRLVDGVILISPDMDVDLFRQQALRIGKLPQPFVVFTSKRDRALAVSSRLNGVRNRLGNLTDVEQVADLQVTLLNTTNFSQGLGHFTVGTSPALINLLRKAETLEEAFRNDASARNGVLPATVLTVRNATEIVVGAPN